MSNELDDWYSEYMTSVRGGVPLIEHGPAQHVIVLTTTGNVTVLSEGHLGSPAAAAVSDVPAEWSPGFEPSAAPLSAGKDSFQGSCLPEWYTLPDVLPRWDLVVCALPCGASSPPLFGVLNHETRCEPEHRFDHLAGL